MSSTSTIPTTRPGRNMDPFSEIAARLGIDSDTTTALTARAVQACRDVHKAHRLLEEAIDRMDFVEEVLEATFEEDHDDAHRARVRHHFGYDAFTDVLADYVDQLGDLVKKWPALADAPPADQRGCGYLRMDILNRNVTSLLSDGISIDEIHSEIDRIGPFVAYAQDWGEDDLGDNRFGRKARSIDEANRAMCARLAASRAATA